MESSITLDETLFRRDPTRELEEVQKVGAIEQARRDVEEFCETESAREVLKRLSEIVPKSPAVRDPRFLYLHATFGSGKTHLLKLISYATGQTDAPEEAVRGLSSRFEGFRKLDSAIAEAPTERFVPVFLNLLDRDASAEPPIPVLIYEAIGERLGYPTDPRWLLEFLLQIEEKAPGMDVWGRLQEKEVGGRGLMSDRGQMRTWLYEAVPPVLAEAGTSCGREDVKTWVEEAEAAVEGARFGPEDLSTRVEQAQSLLSRRGGEKTELLIGLDEIALFIGDNRSRYEELRRTMEALISGPNPVTIGTGQWGLQAVHGDFVGDPDPEAWYSQEVELEGADTETIVRQRWLQKDKKSAVEYYVEPMPSPPDVLTNGGASQEEAVAAYPLRPGDLHWIREAMQSLLTGGRGAATEHIQGRALLVLVRALFVRQGWAEKELGAVVPWPDLLEALRSETNLVPTWAEELLSRLEASAEGVDVPVQEVAETIFLLNQAGVPASEETVAYLLMSRVDEAHEKRKAATAGALDWLSEKKYVFEEPDGEQVTYRLLTKQEVSVAEKVEKRADTISYPRLRSTIKKWIRDYGSLLRADGNRQEVDIGGERSVPLTFHYSILEPIPSPSDQSNTVSLRVLVEGQGSSHVEDWTEKNGRAESLEDGLIRAKLPPDFERRLRRHVATGDVLQNETRPLEDLKSDHLRKERVLKEELRSALDEADVIGSGSGGRFGTYSSGLKAFVTQEVIPRKFPDRRALTRALQPISDGPTLARFFRKDSPGESEWPLSEKDAQMLGVDLGEGKFRESGWNQEFWEEATSQSTGSLLSGEEVLEMIEGPGGAFLGTSVEALQALLLALAAGRKIQLRTDGGALRDPEEMGRALSTKTQVRRLSIRLEPPQNQEAVERLQETYRLITEAGEAPGDPEEIAQEIAEWARENVGVVETVKRFVETNFEKVSIQSLSESLESADSKPPSEVADEFSREAMKKEAQAFRRAQELKSGSYSGLWERYESIRFEVDKSMLPAKINHRLEEASRKEEIPDPDWLESLVQEAEEELERRQEEKEEENGEGEGSEEGQANVEDEEEEEENGSGSSENSGDETSGGNLEELLGNLEEKTEEKEELSESLIKELQEKAAGRVVLVESKR